MFEPEIVVHSSARDNGMANMVAELIRANVATSPYKALCFRVLKATVAVEVVDAEVSATLVFNRGSCVLYDGIEGRTDLKISADSESIIELSSINLVAGMPFYFDQTGMSILSKLLLGSIRIKGAVFSPLSLHLLTVVLSVN